MELLGMLLETSVPDFSLSTSLLSFIVGIKKLK